MSDKDFARRLLRHAHGASAARSKPADALMAWVKAERDSLWPGDAWSRAKDEQRPAGPKGHGSKKLGWSDLPALIERIDDAALPPGPAAQAAAAIAELLAFTGFDRVLLAASVALHRVPRLARLRSGLDDAGFDMAGAVVAMAAGDPAGGTRRLRASGPVALGLLDLDLDRGGRMRVEPTWTLNKIIDRALVDPIEISAALLGPSQASPLTLADFGHLGDAVDLLRRLLIGAAGEARAGINILLHGPPGTGKTEFARTLAASASLALHAVGESDDYGEEPDRTDRVAALRLSQRILARRGGAVLLFDEMEDFIGAARRGAGGDWVRRDGSKIFANRTFESNPVPTIWTTNSIDDVDPAYLRRMSFVLKLDHPPRRARAGIVARLAADERVAFGQGPLAGLVDARPAASSVARGALVAARLTGGGEADAAAVARSLIDAIEAGGTVAPSPKFEVDLDLYESDPPVPALVARLGEAGLPADFSLLLTGPPGTGKTALAALVADRLDRELVVKRASDILSKWVGGTERNIADAFAEAADRRAVLFFDEIDSLLADRSGAHNAWEVSQVNELLTALDTASLPVIAATNFAERLDSAAMRRFVFKLALKPMSADRAAYAFRRFYEVDPPPGLAAVRDLTAGDFALVARQLRYRDAASPREIVALLAAEAAARPGSPMRTGF